jgi:hypothetical protein
MSWSNWDSSELWQRLLELDIQQNYGCTVDIDEDEKNSLEGLKDIRGPSKQFMRRAAEMEKYFNYYFVKPGQLNQPYYVLRGNHAELGFDAFYRGLVSEMEAVKRVWNKQTLFQEARSNLFWRAPYHHHQCRMCKMKSIWENRIEQRKQTKKLIRGVIGGRDKYDDGLHYEDVGEDICPCEYADGLQDPKMVSEDGEIMIVKDPMMKNNKRIWHALIDKAERDLPNRQVEFDDRGKDGFGCDSDGYSSDDSLGSWTTASWDTDEEWVDCLI